MICFPLFVLAFLLSVSLYLAEEAVFAISTGIIGQLVVAFVEPVVLFGLIILPVLFL
jgi:hypothetical protein